MKYPFRQYIPRKPAKYGIKLHALCNAKIFYAQKIEAYAGKQPVGSYKADKKFNSSQAMVMRLLPMPLTTFFALLNISCIKLYVL